MVSSIRGFARELGSNHVVKGHVERRRARTLSRSFTTDLEYQQLKQRRSRKHRPQDGRHAKISVPFDPAQRTVTFEAEKARAPPSRLSDKRSSFQIGIQRLQGAGLRKSKSLMLREEKDRFDAMRAIQKSTQTFKRYYALTMSVLACMYYLVSPLRQLQG